MGMGQMRVDAGDVAGNLRRAREMVTRAGVAGCDVVVLPECLDVGWTCAETPTLAARIPGPCSDVLCQAAADAGLHVVAGLAERSGGRVHNAAVLISPSGEILLHHRKIHELDIALPLYEPGRSLAVVETAIGCIGLLVCADAFPSSLSLGHALGRMGADAVLSPCAWAVEADHDQRTQPYGAIWRASYTELARLYDVAVVGTSCVGPMASGVWAGRRCIGCSLAVGPGGGILAEGPYGEAAEALVTVRIPLAARPGAGTALTAELRRRGYRGP